MSYKFFVSVTYDTVIHYHVSLSTLLLLYTQHSFKLEKKNVKYTKPFLKFPHQIF